MTSADVTAWSSLRAALWPDAPPEEHAAEIHSFDTGPRRQAAFVADAGNEVVGFIEVSVRHDPVNGCDTSPVGFVEGIYVMPDYQRLGIGHALCAAAEAWTRALGCTEIGSDADVANPQAHAFHLSAGFAEQERVVCYRKRL